MVNAQFFFPKVKLWILKVLLNTLFVIYFIVLDTHRVSFDTYVEVFLLFLVRALGVDFVQFIIGRYRFHRMFERMSDEENEK